MLFSAESKTRKGKNAGRQEKGCYIWTGESSKGRTVIGAYLCDYMFGVGGIGIIVVCEKSGGDFLHLECLVTTISSMLQREEDGGNSGCICWLMLRAWLALRIHR